MNGACYNDPVYNHAIRLAFEAFSLLDPRPSWRYTQMRLP